MSDIYVPGIKSRFDTDKIIEGLMAVERLPKDRAEKNIEGLQTEKGYWQELGRRMTSLRESARSLYSFQNPFSERIARSSDEMVLTATANRAAVEQERIFTVKQIARADRFLSDPLSKDYKVEAGTYGFKIGGEEISLNFKGGSLKEFTEALNRRGRDKIQASVINIKPDSPSLLIESLVTGAENRLSFSGAAENLIRVTGMAERAVNSRAGVLDDVLTVAAGSKNTLRLSSAAQDLSAGNGMVLRFETSTKVTPQESLDIPVPPQGPSLPAAGSVTYGGVTIENDASVVTMPAWSPPPQPVRIDDMNMLSLVFTDGSRTRLPLVRDSSDFSVHQVRLDETGGGKKIASIEITNNNTHRDISLRNVSIQDPASSGDYRPKNAVSTAQDAVIELDGIEVTRPVNNIDDLLPGVTVIAKSPSDIPVRLNIEPNREAVKDAIIGMVGNYNRLMAELNVLTRSDDRIVGELSYLSPEEQAEMRKRLGAFSGDSTLNQFKNGMQRATASPYPTPLEGELALLSQIGIGTDVRRAGATTGYDAARMRGYLEIDEKALDAALQTKLTAIQQLFGADTSGDLIIDSGVAFSLETLSKPYVETGGIITLKTGTYDSKIDQEKRRIATLDRQLEAKEATLKKQYGQMEGAFNRMEQMSTRLNNFTQQANNNNR